MPPQLLLPPRSRTFLVTMLVLGALALLVHAAQASRPNHLTQSIKDGQTLSGDVQWTVNIPGPKNAVTSVAFSVDGVARSTDATNPYAYKDTGVLDTKSLANGNHTFTVVATTDNGEVTNTASAVVLNATIPPPSFTVSHSLSGMQSVYGVVQWTATPEGVTTSDVARVDFLVDAKTVQSDDVAPYGDLPGFFDTRAVPDGSHVFTAHAVAKDGRTASASTTITVANGGSATTQPSFPIYAAFTYPWFPETWTVNGKHVFYRPTLGYYSTTDLATQQAHIREMDYAGLEASISSWWGPGHSTDTRLRGLMQTTVGIGSKLKWAVYYEIEGYGDPTVDKLASDLAHIRDTLATSPAYLRVNGKFVVFVYSAYDTSCTLTDRWKQANQRLGGAAYVSLKVFYGYKNCANQPETWHQYGPSTASDTQPGYSITISPGFWRADEPSPRLARDPARWQSNVAGMVAANVPWKLVATYNEWTEGTAVESAQDWSSASGHGTYIDTLRRAIVGP